MAIIAHAGFLHETNTFAPTKATWDDFLRAEGAPGLTQGDDLLNVFPSVNVATGGFIHQMREFGHDLKPSAAHEVGVGGTFTFALGGKRFTEGDPPFEAEWTVRGLSDGQFTCTGPFYKGFHAQLGPMAYLQTGGVGVIVSTHRMQAADQEMFRHIGCEPTAQRILVLKSSVHFRGDFTDIASEIVVVEAPGSFVDRPEKLPYRHLRPGVRLCPKGPVYPGV